MSSENKGENPITWKQVVDRHMSDLLLTIVILCFIFAKCGC